MAQPKTNSQRKSNTNSPVLPNSGSISKENATKAVEKLLMGKKQKPEIHRVGPCSVLSRIKGFLPAMQQADAQLPAPALSDQERREALLQRLQCQDGVSQDEDGDVIELDTNTDASSSEDERDHVRMQLLLLPPEVSSAGSHLLSALGSDTDSDSDSDDVTLATNVTGRSGDSASRLVQELGSDKENVDSLQMNS